MERMIEAALVRPTDCSKLNEARRLLVESEGEACMVELSAVIGSIDLFNKLTQGTGRPALPKAMTGIMRFVFAIIRFFYELFFQAQ
mmetsp:Transcript_33166/g.61089  ORF Transcript_33166/g.61089 Transcript_33166/m.61089 type:complete len:86 (+) Transcript_33166:324-581(+)